MKKELSRLGPDILDLTKFTLDCFKQRLLLVKNLTPAEIRKLFQSIILITQKSLKLGGTMIRTYSDLEMKPGKYQPLIYGKIKPEMKSG